MKSVWRSGRNAKPRLGRLLRSPAGLLPGPDRDRRLLELVALVARVGVVLVQEGRQALLLVALEQRRRRPPARRTSTSVAAATASPPSAAKCVHFVPGDEQQRERDRDVDDARAEVRLGHHQHRRHQRQQHDPRRSPRGPTVRRTRSIRNADSASTSSTLPSSEGWKRKNGSSSQRREPRVTPAGRQHEQDQPDHRAVEADLQLAEARVVDARQHEHQHEAERPRRRPGA